MLFFSQALLFPKALVLLIIFFLSCCDFDLFKSRKDWVLFFFLFFQSSYFSSFLDSGDWAISGLMMISGFPSFFLKISCCCFRFFLGAVISNKNFVDNFVILSFCLSTIGRIPFLLQFSYIGFSKSAACVK